MGMRNQLADILGVDLAKALAEDGEVGHGCARELRFDAVDVGDGYEDGGEDDVSVYEEGLHSDDGVTEGDEQEDEEGEGVEVQDEGAEFEEDEVECGVEGEVDGAGAVGSSFITPKKNTVMVNTVFGVEEEVLPPTVGMVFGSWDEVDTYFWSYCRQKGFGIVRATSGWVNVKKDLEKGKCYKQRKNAKWTYDCYGYASRKRKEDALKEGFSSAPISSV